jgi:hypothetical protein
MLWPESSEFFGITLGGLFGAGFQYRLEFGTGLGGGNSRAEFQRSGKIDVRVLRDSQRETDFFHGVPEIKLIG